MRSNAQAPQRIALLAARAAMGRYPMPEDVADEFGVHIRTAQRWVKIVRHAVYTARQREWEANQHYREEHMR